MSHYNCIPSTPFQRMSHWQWSKQRSSVVCDKIFITGQSSKYCPPFWNCIKYESNFTSTEYRKWHNKILILVSLSDWLWLFIEFRVFAVTLQWSLLEQRAIRTCSSCAVLSCGLKIPDMDWAVIQLIIHEDFIAVCLIHSYSFPNNYRIF